MNGNRRIGLAERRGQQREGLIELDDQRAVVVHRIAVDRSGEQLAERVAHAPTLDARDAVGRAYRAAVVEEQTLAQPDAPSELIVRDRVALGHLRVGDAVRPDRIQRVEHIVAVVAGHRRRGEHRVQQREIRLWHEPQRRRVGRLRDGGRGQTRYPRPRRRKQRGGGRLQQHAAMHFGPQNTIGLVRDSPGGRSMRFARGQIATRSWRMTTARSPPPAVRCGPATSISTSCWRQRILRGDKVRQATTRRSHACGAPKGLSDVTGVPGEIRTHDPRIRNPVLYPAELRGLNNDFNQL